LRRILVVGVAALALGALHRTAWALSAAQRKLMARRGAEVVATRNLLRKIGLARRTPLGPGSYRETVRGRIRGVRVVRTRDVSAGRAVAVVEYVDSTGKRIFAVGAAKARD